MSASLQLGFAHIAKLAVGSDLQGGPGQALGTVAVALQRCAKQMRMPPVDEFGCLVAKQVGQLACSVYLQHLVSLNSERLGGVGLALAVDKPDCQIGLPGELNSASRMLWDAEVAVLRAVALNDEHMHLGVAVEDDDTGQTAR